MYGHRPEAIIFPYRAADTCLAADPGVASSNPALHHTFVEINHEIISMANPSADSRRVVISYKRTYVPKILVDRTGKSVVR